MLRLLKVVAALVKYLQRLTESYRFRREALVGGNCADKEEQKKLQPRFVSERK